MKPILLAATLIFVASAKLHATEALIFDGGGYNLYILVGFGDQPVVAQVRFTAPGAKDWVHLPEEQLQIEKFDMKARVLVMRFSNPKKDPELPSLRFPFPSKRTRPSSLLGAKNLGAHSIGSTSDANSVSLKDYVIAQRLVHARAVADSPRRQVSRDQKQIGGEQNGLPNRTPIRLLKSIKNCTSLTMSPEIDERMFAFNYEHSSNSR